MKQYVNPVNGFTAKINGTKDYSNIVVYNKEGDYIYSIDTRNGNESMVLELQGFIEKEEQSDTDTKCIPNYIVGKTYIEGEVVACKKCGGDCTDKWTPKCPQTDTKWIDDVYEDLQNDENSKGLSPGDQYYYLEKEILKKAILSHLPK